MKQFTLYHFHRKIFITSPISLLWWVVVSEVINEIVRNELIRAPDIVNPFNLSKVHYLPKSHTELQQECARDLEIETLLSQIWDFEGHDERFSDKLTNARQSNAGDIRAWVYENILMAPSDVSTAQYRLDVFDGVAGEPMNWDADGISLFNIQSALWNLFYAQRSYKMTYSHTDFGVGICFLEAYISAIKAWEPLPQIAKSQGLKELDNYFAAVQDSPDFKDLCDFVKIFRKKSSRLEFAISSEFNNRVATHHYEPTHLRLSFLQDTPGSTENQNPPPESNCVRLFTESNDFTENRITEILTMEIKHRIDRIVGAYNRQIEQTLQLLFPIEFYATCSRYFSSWEPWGFGCRPQILEQNERKMIIKNAVHPFLIDEADSKDLTDGKLVPNNIEYTPENNFAIITGPNTAGKSTYIRTVGLLALMAMKGLRIPAESAVVSFADIVVTHFFAKDSLLAGESQYAAEMGAVRKKLDILTPYSLFLADEPCRGSDYEEILTRTQTIFDYLYHTSIPTFVTTHLHLLAQEAETRYPAGRNLSAEVIPAADGKGVQYTYRIIPGRAKTSMGYLVAERAGVTAGALGQRAERMAERYPNLVRSL